MCLMSRCRAGKKVGGARWKWRENRQRHWEELNEGVTQGERESRVETGVCVHIRHLRSHIQVSSIVVVGESDLTFSLN